jgi:hypothetical protein
MSKRRIIIPISEIPLRNVVGAVLGLLVLALAGGVVTAMVMGCAMMPPGGSVASHEKSWAEKGSDSYQILVKVIHGPVSMESEFRILVVKGQVVKTERRSSVMHLSPDIPFEPVRPEGSCTVAGLFRQVRELQSAEYASHDLTVDYDATLGYPRKIVSQPKPNSGILDGYGSWEVLSLELTAKVE